MKTINGLDAADLLEQELGVKPDSFLKDKRYVLMPEQWYFESPRWFGGFRRLEYVADGNDCDDFQRTGREEMQQRFLRTKEVSQGGLPVFRVKVMTMANIFHEVMAVILPSKKVMLIDRTADRIIRCEDVREVYNVYPA